jgi:hypothetical protein
MQFISVWSVRPGVRKEAVERFLATKALPPEGVKMLGRWHKVDGSGGFTLFESDDATAIFAYSAEWVDLVEIHSTAVADDPAAAEVLAKTAGRK